MLEVKNLCKEYKSKKGTVTKALDNVSLTFPEKGMVFILGKSGSGKSTLLNICGGLDKADSGEIIIKGKSSSGFSGQDFDSYRNTYVGFVFQEYNVLDEFSVAENIALALELQNKKSDKAVIDKILSDVDMTDFASRKPNTLSGGQKQRVAIARALVKEPEIIMADEPTGALDSKTGQQVFDTLKKLSRDKLVLVISHDRDFAEQYGDRIIELKDGRVISDQTRAEEGDNAKNIRFFGTDTVCVANGREVTDEDLISIKNFLNKTGGAAVISTSREHIANIKESRPEINVGSFENIGAQPVSKEYPGQKLIRSHLPVRHAVKMGANSLKSKPIRLVFTIFLSIVAFILFGLASTLMLFDGKKVTVQTFMDSDDAYMILSKAYYGRYTSYENDEISYQDKKATKQETYYTLAEYKKLADKYPGSFAAANFNGRIDNIRLGQYGGQYYSEYIKKAVLVNDSAEMLYGRPPAATDEIAISDYVYNSITLPKTKFTGSDGNELTFNKPEDILYSDENKITLRISDKDYKVVGVYKIETPASEFAELEQAAKEDKLFAGDKTVIEKWQNALDTSVLPSVMVTEELINKLARSNNGYLYGDKNFDYMQGGLRIGCKADENSMNYFNYAAKYSADNKKPLLDLYDFSGNKVTSLSSNSVAMSVYTAGNIYARAYYDYKHNIENSDEEWEKVNAEIDAAREAYQAEHLLVDKYFNKNWFEDVHNEWSANFENAKEIEGDNFNEEEYRLNNPEPQKTDKYDYGEYIYYNGDQDYWDAYYEYINGVEAKAGTFKAYKTLIYNVRKEAEKNYIANNPKPEYPENASNEEWNAYQTALREWESGRDNAMYYAENAVNPFDKLWNIKQYDLSKEEILDLFVTLRGLFPDYNFEPGIKNDYIGFEDVTFAAVFFEDIQDSCIYLSDDLYAKYYVSNGNNYRYGYVSKYVAPEDAFIDYIYIPYDHSNAMVQEIVNITYEHGADDATAMIRNTQMRQLEMFIETAETLGTVFLITGIVFALFAFLLMFNFISASISAKKKEIGILRAIGARTLDVYKIFISESLIIALICFVIAVGGTFGLSMLLNNIITSGTFIEISIFTFGFLSVLCIFGIALITAIISTVIPVAIYSRKPPIASIRAI